MPIKMTRAEYQAKYGVAPSVSSAPMQMTRAEYNKKYGVTPEGKNLSQIGSKQPFGTSLIAQPANFLSNVGIGLGSTIGKTGFGLGEAVLKGGAKVTGSKYLADRASEVGKLKEEIYQKPFEEQLQTGGGKLGTAIGGLAPYVSGASLTKVPTVLSAKTILPYALKSGAIDTGINLAQTGGDLKSAGVTGATSALASSIIPGGGIARRIISGATQGYVGDVGSGLAGYRGEDRTGGKAFIPGLGTAFGTAMGGANAYGYSKTPEYQQQKIQKTVDKRMSTLDSLQGNNKPLNKVIQSADKTGLDTKKYLAESDLLVNSIDKEGTIRTKNALSNLDETISPWENKVGESLQQEGKMVSLKEVQNYVDDVINKSGLVGSAKQTAKNNLLKEIEALSLESDINGNIPLKLVHDLKVQTNRLNARSFLDPEKNAIGKTIGRGLKEFTEANTQALDVKTYNQELSKLYGVRDVLKSLDGKKVLGGRAGKYFSQTIGAVVGASVGGIPGGIAGAEAGNLIREKQLQGQFGGKTGIPVTATEKMKEALKPQSNLGNRQINQATASSANANGIIPIIPQTQKNINNPLNALELKDGKFILHKNEGKISTKPLIGAGVGSLAGFEKDEQGNIHYNPIKGMAGALGGALIAKSGKAGMSTVNITKNLTDQDITDMFEYAYAKVITPKIEDKFRKIAIREGFELPKSNKARQELASNLAESAFQNSMTNRLMNTNAKSTKPLTPREKEIERLGLIDIKEMRSAKIKKMGLDTDLLSQAKKFDTPEEFVKAQSTIYHGTPQKFEKFDTSKSEGGATWFTADKNEITSGKAGAVQGTGQKLNVMERYIKPNLKLATPEMEEKMYTDQLIAEGYRGIKYPAGDYGAEWTKLFNPNEDTITRSQLSEIWKKAHNK